MVSNFSSFISRDVVAGVATSARQPSGEGFAELKENGSNEVLNGASQLMTASDVTNAAEDASDVTNAAEEDTEVDDLWALEDTVQSTTCYSGTGKDCQYTLPAHQRNLR